MASSGSHQSIRTCAIGELLTVVPLGGVTAIVGASVPIAVALNDADPSVVSNAPLYSAVNMAPIELPTPATEYDTGTRIDAPAASVTVSSVLLHVSQYGLPPQFK